MIKTDLPKQVEKAIIFFKGDPSVGIPSCNFEMQLYFNCECYSNSRESLEEIRGSIRDTYALICGDESPIVMFDFEVEAEQKYWDKIMSEDVDK
jgi:hypothetical protein